MLDCNSTEHVNISRFHTHTRVLKHSTDVLERWHVRTQMSSTFAPDILLQLPSKITKTSEDETMHKHINKYSRAFAAAVRVRVCALMSLSFLLTCAAFRYFCYFLLFSMCYLKKKEEKQTVISTV